MCIRVLVALWFLVTSRQIVVMYRVLYLEKQLYHISGIVSERVFGDWLKNIIGMVYNLAVLSSVWKEIMRACSWMTQ